MCNWKQFIACILARIFVVRAKRALESIWERKVDNAWCLGIEKEDAPKRRILSSVIKTIKGNE